ncbi:hypothetical protein [Plantibacter sp. YIM 135347]|uniref:hypothetical protein n=1 Tax=Plantibacter sp. YIM 135347 TaxID=3423919 RepID=UPI003D335D00
MARTWLAQRSRALGATIGAALVGTILVGAAFATGLIPGASPAHAAGNAAITTPVDGATVYRTDFTVNGTQASGFDVRGTADKGTTVVLSYWRSVKLYEAAKPCFTEKPAATCAQQPAEGSGTPELRFDGQPVKQADDGSWGTRVNMTQWLKGADPGEYDITLALVVKNDDGSASIGDPVRVVYDSTKTQGAADALAEPAAKAGLGPVPIWVWLLAAFLLLDAVALFLILRLRRNRRREAERVEDAAPRRRSTHRAPPTL